MITVRRNRAKTFITALEVLRDATNELIEHVRLDVEDKTPAEIEAFADQHGYLVGAFEAFDDGLEYLPSERNSFAEIAEIEASDLRVSFKEQE